MALFHSQTQRHVIKVNICCSYQCLAYKRDLMTLYQICSLHFFLFSRNKGKRFLSYIVPLHQEFMDIFY